MDHPFVLAVFAFALQQGAAAQTVRIGFIGPLSGGSSDFGNSARYGAELAVSEINEVGGFMGRKFELVVRDDKGDPEVGLHASVDLVRKEKVH
jgi:branched-chain amino acid transport system substrate-binding protein